MNYYAIKVGVHTRIERALTPRQASALAYGRGSMPDTWYLDLGTRVSEIQSHRKLTALLESDRWRCLHYAFKTDLACRTCGLRLKRGIQ